MIFNELGDADSNLTLLLRNQISQADRQQQPSYLSWDALNSIMVNIGDEQFDYDSFKNSYDTNPMIKQLVQRFDARGVELKTKNKNPKKGQPGGEGEVAKMAKAATARRQNESYSNTKQSLFEGIDSQTVNEALVWKRILRPIVEAQLTPDQINSLFQAAQQSATDAGGNRTLAGKGVDVANAASQAFEKVKAAMQNSGPIQGFEAQYDKLAAKIKEKTGGDQGVMKYIQQYRDFAAKHPIAQKVIYAAAIAALGALAVGGSIAAVSGGPIVLGLFKMTDRLLQGDKLTSAAWQGVKVAGGAAAAVGVGKAVRGALGLGAPTGASGAATEPTARTSKLVNRPGDFSDQPQGGGAAAAASNLSPGQMAKTGLARLKDMVAKGEVTDYNSYQKALSTIARDSGASGMARDTVQRVIDLNAGAEAARAAGGQIGGGSANIIKKFIALNGGTPDEAAFGADEKTRQSMISQMQGDEKAFAAKGAAPQGGSGAAVVPKISPADQKLYGLNPDGGATPEKMAAFRDQAIARGTNPGDPVPAAEPELKGKALADKRAADMAKAAAAGADGSVDILNGPPEIQGNKQLSAAYKSLISKIQSNPDYNVRNLPGDIQRFTSQNSVGGLQATKDASTLNLLVQKAGGGNMNGFLDAVKNAAPQIARGATTSAANFESAYESRLSEQLARQMSESQIKEMFRQVDEGVWDAVKKGAGAAAGAVASGAKAVAGSRIGQAVGATAKDAAGAVAQKVGNVATNMTTKVTADKLMKAWKAAKSPTDSAQVYKIMKAQGLDDATLANIFKTAGIEIPPATPAAAPAPAAPKAAPAPAAPKAAPAAAAPKAAPAAAAPKAAPAAAAQAVAPVAAPGQETDAQRRARIKAKQQAFQAQQGLKESMEYLRLSLIYNQIKH